MASTELETACLGAFGPFPSKGASTYESLHGRMAQMRIAQDSGISLTDSTNATAVRQLREQTRVRAILQQNMGSAMGMATTSELLFKEALPGCARWGDRVMQTLATRGFEYVDMDKYGGMGASSRPSIPGPLQASQRVGPHGSPEALHQTELFICSYGQMVEEARAEATSAKAASAKAAVSHGILMQDASELPGFDDDDALPPPTDRRAEAEDGRRVWPPAVFKSTAAAKEARDVTRQVIAVVEGLDVKDHVLACVPGAYTAAVEFVLSAQLLAPIHRDAYAALGLGALSGKRREVVGAGERAHLLAAMAFATGHSDLGEALTALVSGPIDRCGQKPWA